jgi:hypothetical protein
MAEKQSAIRRPLIVIPARFSPGATALRYEAEVTEAVTLQDHAGWYLGVQWHPEDSAATDPVQAEVFRHLVDAAAEHMRRPDRRVSASAHV